MSTTTTTTKPSKRGLIALVIIVLGAIAIAVASSAGGSSASSCRAQWESAPAHSYEPYDEYKRNVCDSNWTPAPVDNNPADQPVGN